MIRYFAEFENDRFFDAAVLDNLFPRKGSKIEERCDKLQTENVLVDHNSWVKLARKSLRAEIFESPRVAGEFLEEWRTLLRWDLSFVSLLQREARVANGGSLSVPALVPALTPGSQHGGVFNRSTKIPILFSPTRHSEEVLLGGEQANAHHRFEQFEGAPDSLLHQLLSEETPFAYQVSPDGLTIWRMRGNMPASFSILFDRALESTISRKRSDILLSTVFTPSFLYPSKSSILSADETLTSDSYGRYPIHELRQRFKNAMELLGTAVYETAQGQKRGTKVGRGQHRQPEVRDPRRLPIPQQVRTEVSRYLFRLLFLFSAEAKGQISNQMVSNQKEPSIYTTYFLRKRAAAMRRAGNRGWLKTTTFLWDSISDTFDLCRHGLKTDILDIPPFDGQLFDPSRIPLLSSLSPGLPDRVMCEVIDEISRVTTRHGTHEYCDFKTLQVNHLGEIYQWLLEFEPKVLKGEMWAVRNKDKDEPFFITEDERKVLNIKEGKHCKGVSPKPVVFKMNPKSTVRSQTGTHFTQAALGRRIAEEALTDILRPLEEKHDVEAILNLSVLEPCIGSAGIMAEAVTIAAKSVFCASLKSASDQTAFREGKLGITYTQLQNEKRRVVERMVYGVDKMMDAVELARAALWQECATQTLPLPFLNHKIRTGDALVGTWFLEKKEKSIPRWIFPGTTPFELWKDKSLRESFPEAAEIYKKLKTQWSEAKADDAIIAKLPSKVENVLRHIEKARRKFLGETSGPKASEQVHKQEALHAQVLDFTPERPSTSALALLEATDSEFVKSVERLPEYRRLRLLGDIATALYFWPVDRARYYPSPVVYKNLILGLVENDPKKYHGKAEIQALRTALLVGFQKTFFHWEVEYPELFLDRKKPDICLSNPPWDNPNVNEATFWKQYHPLAGKEGYGNEKVAEITSKLKNVPSWDKHFLGDRQFSHFMMKSSDYATLVDGMDLHRPFVEQLRRLASKRGTLLLPQSMWINEGSEASRRVSKDTLGWDRLVGFVNYNKKFFSNVHASYCFAICRYNPGKISEQLHAIFRVRSIDELESIESQKVAFFDASEKKEFVSFKWDFVEILAKDYALCEARTAFDIEVLAALAKTGRTAGEWLPENGKYRDFDLSQDLKNGNLVPVESKKPGDLPLWRGGHFHIWKPYFQQEDRSKPFKKGETRWVQLAEETNGEARATHTSLVARKDALDDLPKVVEDNGTYYQLPARIIDDNGTPDSSFLLSVQKKGDELLSKLRASNDRKMQRGFPVLQRLIKEPEKPLSEEELDLLQKARKPILQTLHGLFGNRDTLLPIYQTWRLAWRCVARSTDARSMIVSAIPPGTVCGNSAYISTATTQRELCWEVAVLGSVLADAFIRFYGAVNVNLPQVRRIPVPDRDSLPEKLRAAIEAHYEWLLESNNPQNASRPNELNALIAVAYSLSSNGAFKREHLKYILDTQFPALFGESMTANHGAEAEMENPEQNESEEREDSDRGAPLPLNHERILSLYDDYISEFGISERKGGN